MCGFESHILNVEVHAREVETTTLKYFKITFSNINSLLIVFVFVSISSIQCTLPNQSIQMYFTQSVNKATYFATKGSKEELVDTVESIARMPNAYSRF